jgi:hypothetical protein
MILEEGRMKRRFVDLSIYPENDVISDPPLSGPKIEYHRHENTALQIAGFFPGLTKANLPDGQGWAAASGESIPSLARRFRVAIAANLGSC